MVLRSSTQLARSVVGLQPAARLPRAGSASRLLLSLALALGSACGRDGVSSNEGTPRATWPQTDDAFSAAGDGVQPGPGQLDAGPGGAGSDALGPEEPVDPPATPVLPAAPPAPTTPPADALPPAQVEPGGLCADTNECPPAHLCVKLAPDGYRAAAPPPRGLCLEVCPRENAVCRSGPDHLHLCMRYRTWDLGGLLACGIACESRLDRDEDRLRYECPPQAVCGRSVGPALRLCTADAPAD